MSLAAIDETGSKMNEFTRRSVVAAGAATALAAAAACAHQPSQSAAALAGFTPDELAKIPAALQTSVDAGGVPGAVSLIWRKGKVIQVNTVGLRDVERNLPMERSTIFRIASMTKPVTIATALTLVEQGRMKLDDLITKWAPEFGEMRVLSKTGGALDDTYPSPRSITVEDLTTHRAGMPYSFGPAPLGRALTAKTGGVGVCLGLYNNSLSADDLVRARASLPLTSPPGERFEYGFAFDILGVIVGRAANTSFRQAVLDRICGPLGMKDTDFWIPPGKRDREAKLYIADPVNKTFKLMATPNEPPTPQTFLSGGGGLVSTADDYLAFARMLLRGGVGNERRVLKPESVRLMMTNRLTPEQRKAGTSPIAPGTPSWDVQGLGLGLSVVTDPAGYAARGVGVGSAGSFSWMGMFGGWWQADPVEDMVTLMLVQAVPRYVLSMIPGSPPPPAVATTIPYAAIPGGDAQIAFQKLVYAAVGQ